MRRVLLLAIALTACTGHGLSPQTVAAVALSNALDRIGGELVAEYARRDQACIDDSATEQAARQCLANLDGRWSPVWASHVSLSHAHDRWATAFERGEPTEVQLAELVRGAFCGLGQALDEAGVQRSPVWRTISVGCP